MVQTASAGDLDLRQEASALRAAERESPLPPREGPQGLLQDQQRCFHGKNCFSQYFIIF